MIINADILAWAAAYDGPLFHAALMDAPYEQEFMGKDWDNSGIAFNPETWKAIARHLHPGAFLFVFAGTLNDDLISVAMRQAGLRKFHKCAYWGTGSGFPKATDLPAQIDEDAFQRWLAVHDEEHAILVRFRDNLKERRAAHKAQPSAVGRALVTAAHNAYRCKRLEIKAGAGFLKTAGQRKHAPKFAAAELGYREKDNGYNSKERESFDVTVPATPLAQTWNGYSYGGQLLKPAVETILIFQKPYAGRPVESITTTGAGALNIDGSRIGTAGGGTHCTNRDTDGRCLGHNNAGQSTSGETFHGPDTEGGRWPANLILSCACDDPTAHLPDCPVRCLGEQSGESESKRAARVVDATKPGYEGGWAPLASERGHNDAGTAARFFFQADYMLDRLEQADALFYCPKADRSEREAGLDPRQIAMLGMEEHDESTINDGRQKSIDNPYQRGETTRRNLHPCLKPLSLTRYLATLLLPPAEYAPRRLLVPFAGVASEYIGAILAGWEEIVGVELEESHVKIAEARVAYWQQRRHEFLDPSKPIDAKLDEAPAGQLDMFWRDV